MEQSIIVEESLQEKNKINKNILKYLGIISIIFIISYVGIRSFNNNYIYNEQISENIYIEGINVSGMTMDEAKKNIDNKYIYKPLKIKYEDKVFTINSSDIDFKYNTDEVVKEAYNYNKTNSYFENIKRFIELKKGNSKQFNILALYNENKLNNFVESISKEINRDVVNAKLYISDSGAMSKKYSQVGKEVDTSKTIDLIKQALDKKDFTEVNLVVKEIQPTTSTEMINKVNSVLATHTTNYKTSSEGRAYNIVKASNSTSDILLMPGEEFSYNSLTGTRSKANGYKEAPVIVNGKLEDGIGGGVCQVSTTIYNAALYSGLDITQVKNHSLPSKYADMGKDATVVNGYIDLKFKNPYDYPIYIKNTIHNGNITSTIYGSSLNKNNIKIRTEKSQSGDKDIVKTYRETINSSGNIINTEFIATSVYKRK
ncbi:MAG: VanW family protein [Peptostreptococcaceae bacterium]|nr:VanW family protein [Peptostreptococcaceae bacterium]